MSLPRTEGPASSSRLLRDRFERDAREREQSIARFMIFAGWVLAAIVAATGPLIGWPLASALVALSLGVTGYYAFLSRSLARGWFHPGVHMVNVAIEVSAPAVVIAFDAHFNGAEYALTTPILAGWGALIILSALRMRKRISIAAGAIAAGEYLLIYLLWIRPDLAAHAPLTFSPVFVLLRSAFLFFTGVATAFVASHLQRKAEEALRNIREQELLGKYFLHERIGSGGMAEVFRATYSPEGGFEKQVAIKRLLPAFAEDREFVYLFRHEAELCARLHHPNIVQVLDLARQGSTYFLTMEYVDGPSLKALLSRIPDGALSVLAVAYVGAEISAALDYVHRRTSELGAPLHLVHRDVNPPNILLSRAGEVKLADFGIAQTMNRAPVTATGMVRGKLSYAAPEQLEGRALDGRADLFALGLTLFEALTGKRLFGTGEPDPKKARERLDAELVPPSSLRPDIPKEMDAIVLQLLQWRAEDRIQSAAELRRKLWALPGGAAPYPKGQWLVSKLAQEHAGLASAA
jgi:eukaryotic-like serine/threonine-protein kinase